MSSARKRRRLDTDEEESLDEKPAGPGRPARAGQKLRHMYRELMTDTHKHRHEYVQPGSGGLHQQLDRVDELWQQVEVGQLREAALDSALLRNVAALGAEQAKILNTNLISFESLAFADHLVALMKTPRVGVADDDDDDEEIAPSGRRRRRIRHQPNFTKLGEHCKKYWHRRAPTVDFMYGPMALEAKERKAPQRRQTQTRLAEKVVPQQVDTAHAHEEATTKEVERIIKLLYDQLRDAAEDLNQPVEDTSIAFFDFVLHPSSFNQTVENIFHFSFLVKDGIVALTMDPDDGLPWIQLNRSKDKNDGTPRQQMIVSIDMKEWKELVTELQLEGAEPAIPARPS